MIPFTQYLRPNGRKQETSIERGEEVEKIAHDLIKRGYEFEIEKLQTGHISMTISDPINEEDVVCEICNNSLEVLDAVDRLVLSGKDLPKAGTPREDEPTDEPPTLNHPYWGRL